MYIYVFASVLYVHIYICGPDKQDRPTTHISTLFLCNIASSLQTPRLPSTFPRPIKSQTSSPPLLLALVQLAAKHSIPSTSPPATTTTMTTAMTTTPLKNNIIMDFPLPSLPPTVAAVVPRPIFSWHLPRLLIHLSERAMPMLSLPGLPWARGRQGHPPPCIS